MVGNTLRSMAMRRAMKRGQIAVALILVMIPLLGAIGLGSDLGLLYFHWGILQKAADAAVLAGAGYLPNHPSTAQTTATGYATKNGIRTTEITSNTVAADNMSITMTTSRTVHLFPATGRRHIGNCETDREGRDSARHGTVACLIPVAYHAQAPAAAIRRERFINWCKPALTALAEGAGASAQVIGDGSRSADRVPISF